MLLTIARASGIDTFIPLRTRYRRTGMRYNGDPASPLRREGLISGMRRAPGEQLRLCPQ